MNSAINDVQRGYISAINHVQRCSIRVKSANLAGHCFAVDSTPQ